MSETTEETTSARDDFAEDLQEVFEGGDLVYEDIASALIIRGYSKPRTVTTREEVAALPEGSVILDSAGDVAQLRHGLWCSYETAAMTHNRMAKYTPATVLYEPEPAK